ncbi:MAG: DUF721 domain-containing protein [Leptolyngbya sp.]|nr:DUF721 domain-containing protein [Leptolyngbya sp.]
MSLDALGQVFRQLEQQPAWRRRGQFRRILERWPTVVGPAVARQSRPVRLDQTVLHVAVINPMWAQTLTLERISILNKLNQQLGLNLSDLRFSSGDWFRRPKVKEVSSQSSGDDWPDWLRQHPSFEPGAITTPPSQPHRPTAEESFQRWAALAQQIAAQRMLCPDCRCPAPPGELRRWSRCSICAAKRFSHNGQAQGHRDPLPPWSDKTV